MDMFPSTDSAGRAYGALSGHRGTARRLCSDDQGAHVPAMSDSDRGHVPLSSNRPRHRQLSILADLIAVVEPERCGEVAHQLLDEWHSIGGVFAAPEEPLRESAGAVVASLIVHSMRAHRASLMEDMKRHRVSASDKNLHRYLATAIGRSPVEKILAILLDTERGYLAQVTIGCGDAGRVAFNVKDLVRTAIHRGAHGIIIAHNHPSGNAQPSHTDIAHSKMLDAMCRPLGIEVVDHLIVAWNKVSSLKQLGVL